MRHDIGGGTCRLIASLFATLLPCTLALAEDAPQFQVDPFWPKPLPNNWILGQVAGIATDKYDRIWVVHRPRSLTPRERAAEQNPPEAKCCAAAPPVLLFDASGNLLRSLGRSGPGLSMAGERARHLRRRQRFRLARRQRQEGRPAAQVHDGRQVRAADRQAGPGQRQQRDRPARLARRRGGRRRGEGGVRRRRLRQPARRGVRCGDRRLQAPLGRLRQQAERREDAALRSRRSRRRSSSAIRCTASGSARTG